MNSGSTTTRIIFLTLIGILVLLVALIAILPTILSTEWGKKRLIAYIKENYDADVQVNRLELQWWGGQEVTDLVVHQEKYQMQLTCDGIKTDASLWDLLVRRSMGHVQCNRPYLKLNPSLIAWVGHSDVVLPRDWLRSASLSSLPTFSKIELPVEGTLQCTSGKIELHTTSMQPIVFDEIALDAALSKKILSFTVTSETQQNDVKGKLDAKASVANADTESPSVEAIATISQLPVLGIDQLLSLKYPQWKGVLVSMVGNTADVKLNLLSSAGNFDLDVLATSPLFNAQITTVSADNHISLKSPAKLSLKITPNSWAQLAKLELRLQRLSLTKENTLKVVIDQLMAPIPQRLEDLAQSSFTATISTDAPFAWQFDNNPLVLDRLVMHVNNDSEHMTVDGKLAVVSQGPPAQLTWDAQLNLKENTQSVSMEATALPVDLLGALSGVKTPLSLVLGPVLNTKATGNLSPQGQEWILSVHSPLLTIEQAKLRAGDELSLLEPVAFSYQVIPGLVNPVLPQNKLALAHPVTVKGMVNTLVIPWSHTSDSTMEMSVESERFDFKGKTPFAIQQIKADLLATRDRISFHVSSDLLQAELLAKYQKNGEIALTAPLKIHVKVENGWLQNVSPVLLNLTEPSQLLLTVEPFSFFPKTVNALSFKGTLASSQVSMIPYPGAPQLSLNNLSIPFQWNAKTQIAEVQLQSLVKPQEGEQGSIAMKSSWSHVDFNHMDQVVVNATMDLVKLPSSLVDAFLGKPLAQMLAGTQLNSTLNLASTPQKQTLQVNVTSPLLAIKSSFVTDGSVIKGAIDTLNWTLTPQSYLYLDHMVVAQQGKTIAFELKEPTTFKASVSELSLPVLPATGRIPTIQWEIASLQGKGQGHNPRISFLDNGSQETIQLTDFTFSFSKLQSDRPLTLTLDSQVSSGAGKGGTFSAKTTIEHLFTEKNELNLHTLVLDTNVNIKQFPSRALDLVARMKGRTDAPFSKVFGDVINASLVANLKDFTGPVSLNINSPNVRFAMDSSIKEGVLRLEKDLYAQMNVTQEMSRVFLKDVNPLSITYFYAQAPVTLEIPAKGFYLPLRPFDLGKLAMPLTTIELGKIACRNEGNVNIALGLLRSKQFEVNRELQLWFAPVQFTLSQGILDLERTEILLADTYDVAIWGKILLVDDYVDMLLGLTASTLSQAFGIKNLPKDYVLTIPMKGRSDNVKIDSSKATAKIALLLAAQQKVVTDAFGKSGAGAILGGVLQQMATLPDSKAKIPPCQTPFPLGKEQENFRYA